MQHTENVKTCVDHCYQPETDRNRKLKCVYCRLKEALDLCAYKEKQIMKERRRRIKAERRVEALEAPSNYKIPVTKEKITPFFGTEQARTRRKR